MGSWPTLEIAKLIVGVLTPMSVALLGWLFSRQLKRLDLSNWTNQKLIEKRLAIYDDIAPKLNQLLCFFTWVGLGLLTLRQWAAKVRRAGPI